MTTALTERQAEVLAAIKWHWREQGCPPTVREIGDAIGIPFTNGVICHLKSLAKKGEIVWSREKKSRGVFLPGLLEHIRRAPQLAEG